MELETAIPLGLLVNEIVANSVVHAFPNNRKGEIKVVLRREGDEFTLRISDNGVGIPDNVEFEKAETLGFQLIKNLAKQLDGQLELQKDNGTIFTLKFKELDYKKRF